MKTTSLSHAIHACLLAAAIAAPAAFADGTTPPPATAPHDGSMQEGTTPPATSAVVAPTSAPTASASVKPKTWKELDTNKDGKLSKDEAAGDPSLAEDFDTADTNKDGYVSKAEYNKREADRKQLTKNDSKK